MFNLNQTLGRTAIVDGKECLFFSGYSYLGMSHVPEFVELVKEGIDKYGWIFPSSRISNTQLELFSAFEAKLSEITGMEETVCFSSGYLAARAVVGIMQHEYSYFFSPPQTHPAISLNSGIQTFAAKNFQGWSKLLVEHIKTIRTPNEIILSYDSINPLSAELNDSSFLNLINQKIICVIDDSHGVGLINNGTGICKNIAQKENISYISSYSLSKAYNLIGGAVSCSKQIAQQLRTSPFYTASTSISPAFAYAFLNGQALYQQQREKLKKNIEVFQTLTDYKLKSHPELPIFILHTDTDEKKLEEAGIIISSFAYPNPEGEKINRIVLNALHTEEDLNRLAEALK